MLSGLALLAQEFIDIALRRHGTFLHGGGDVHGGRLLLLLLRGRRGMRGHRRVLVGVHGWLMRWMLVVRMVGFRVSSGVIVE